MPRCSPVPVTSPLVGEPSRERRGTSLIATMAMLYSLLADNAARLNRERNEWTASRTSRCLFPALQAGLAAGRQNDSRPNLKDIQRQTSSFASSGGVNVAPMDFTGTGEPIDIASTEASLCVVARAINDSGQISTDAGPVCSG